MNFLKSIFKAKDEPIKSYADFWTWFQQHAQHFHRVVKDHKDVEKDFLDKLSSKLTALKDGYFYLTGMCDPTTVELILTADGNPRNIAFVEELVAAAPKIPGWRITALKPPSDIADTNIQMGDYQFTRDNISFYANELPEYPDEIDITIVHNDLTEENKKELFHGIYIFLDNYLGELDFLNNIDNLTVIGRDEASRELIPIEKLKDFLSWRQKEFIEKYEGTRYDTKDDTHSLLEATLQSGDKLIAVINTELLNWDSKASHPWIAALTIKYDGSNDNGMPNKKDYELLDSIEEELMQSLRDHEGHLNIGRQTAQGEREIYFACKDFRKPSKVFFGIQQKYAGSFEIEYDIYKDKYWRSFERFNCN
jgi:hypothetical protein